MSHEKFAQFFIRDEYSEIRKASNDEIVAAAREIMSRKLRRGTSMTSPKLVKDFLRASGSARLNMRRSA
jgi:hypothetical protein